MQLRCLFELKMTMTAETIKGKNLISESVFFKGKITWFVTHEGSWTFFVSSLLQWSSNFMAFTKQSIGNAKQFLGVVKKGKGFLVFVCSLHVVWLFRKLSLILRFYLLFWNGHLWHLVINMTAKVRTSKRWSIGTWWHPLRSLIDLEGLKTLFFPRWPAAQPRGRTWNGC